MEQNMNGEDEDYADSLTKQMDITICNLTKKRETLQNKIQEYDDVKHSISNSKDQPIMISLGTGYFTEKSKPEAIEYLERSISRMKQVISEITSNIDHAKDTRKKFLLFNDFVKQNGSKEEEKEKLNEEGLPFMDIQEEIDEDGNVINVKINDTLVESKSNSIKEHIQKENHRSTSRDIAGTKYIEENISDEDESLSRRNIEITSDAPEETDQIQELMSDMGLTTKSSNNDSQIIDEDLLLDKIDQLEIGNDDKFQLKQIVVEEYNKLKENNQEKQPTLAIDKYDDLLQLELVADDLNDEQDISYADDEEWDFEFEEEEEEEEDEDDDDLADELLYGNQPTSVLGASVSERTNTLLWEQIRKLRNQKIDNGKKKKSVRFAETLEIKEVENISESLKNPPPAPPKISLFKQNLVVNKQSEEKNDYINEPQVEPIMESTIIEHKFEVQTRKNKVVSNEIIEKVNDESYVEVSKFNKPISRFKAARLEQQQENANIPTIESSPLTKDSPTEENIVENNMIEHEIVSHDIVEREIDESYVEIPQASTKKPVSKFKASRIGKVLTEKRPVTIPIPTESINKTVESPSENDQPEIEIKKTQLDYSSLHQDMDTMAKAYILGMYDDDIVTEGPVVDKVDDFEVLNKMIESMPSKESAKKPQKRIISDIEFDESLDEVGMNEVDDDEEEEEEKFFEDMEDNTGPILADEIVEKEIDSQEFDENEILTSEINENYHRLRNKLILDQNGFKKSQQELEFEPIDEEGNPIKVSRFHAARMRGGITNGLLK